MKKKLFFLPVSFFVLTTFAQKNIRPGYVILETGDTISGNINYREWRGNPGSVVINSDNTGKISRTINMAEYKSVLLNDPSEVYEKWTVSLDMSYINEKNYTVINEDSVRLATVFLKKIYNGHKLSLYSYFDVKEHFFVLSNGDMQELLLTYKKRGMKEREENTPNYTVFYRFRDGLSRYYDWQTEKELTRKIHRSNYTEDNMIEIIAWMDKGSRQKDLLPNGAYYNIYAGLAFQSLTYYTQNFQSKEFVDIKFDPERSFLFGMGVRFFTKRDVQKTFLNAGFKYSRMKFSGEHVFEYLYPTRHEREEYLSQMHLASFVSGLGHRFPINSGTSINIYLNGNFSMLIQSKFQTDIYDDDTNEYKKTDNLDFKNQMTFQLTAGGGIEFNRNFELMVLYQSPYNINRTVLRSSTISGVSVCLSYLRPFKKTVSK